ncbi:hypothetical protein, partial [Chromobacterium piscinae]|uniref:hypothetical protein n=1 Tax=Chromobacterium piscinae TaxID=686831 RepID=UPI003260FCAE
MPATAVPWPLVVAAVHQVLGAGHDVGGQVGVFDFQAVVDDGDGGADAADAAQVGEGEIEIDALDAATLGEGILAGIFQVPLLVDQGVARQQRD